MGCQPSKPISPSEEKRTDVEQTVEWKLLPSSLEARKKFEADGTLSKNSDPAHLELRSMLDDPVAQPAIFKYAKEVVKAQDIFMCWVDIQEFKTIPTENYRRSKALHIFHKYIKPDAILVVGDIELTERERYRAELSASKEDPSILTMNFYDKIQLRCFLGIYHNIFLPFRQTDVYLELTKQLQQRYNHVKLADFEYFGKLGEGGFGFVVHCRKKSTGKHYAMKLQTKKGLLECFADDPWRADFEKQAFASCQHPFIVNLDYSFQTDTLAIMVLGLATAGDLQKALNKAAEERLSEDRVRFYVAEIVLALSYLHQMGLMYRDLKPNNVLLNEDGHIQLVDLGGVADEYGVTLVNPDGHNMPLFTQSYNRQLNQAIHNRHQIGTPLDNIRENEEEAGVHPHHHAAYTHQSRPKRKLSIMGTFG